MKKSNILLAAGFLAIVGLVSAIHISLYAKYKAGHYTIYNSDEELVADAFVTFPNIAFLALRNVPNATVKFSDVAKVKKTANKDLEYSRHGDTLVITAREDANPNRISGQTLYVPLNATLDVSRSSLTILPSKRSTECKPVIYLKRSDIRFAGTGSPFSLAQIRVVATDSSSVSFRGKMQVDLLNVELSQSSLEYTDGDLGQLSILTDSLSHISLPSKQLLKATIKSIATQ